MQSLSTGQHEFSTGAWTWSKGHYKIATESEENGRTGKFSDENHIL